MHFTTNHPNALGCCLLHQSAIASSQWCALGQRKAVTDEAMHRLGCSYIVNLAWSLVIYQSLLVNNTLKLKTMGTYFICPFYVFHNARDWEKKKKQSD